MVFTSNNGAVSSCLVGNSNSTAFEWIVAIQYPAASAQRYFLYNCVTCVSVFRVQQGADLIVLIGIARVLTTLLSKQHRLTLSLPKC